jgi:hypothetical protein
VGDLQISTLTYPDRSLEAWRKGRHSLLKRSGASRFIKDILCHKAGKRPGTRFFGEAFVSANTDHTDGWYGSFKWLTTPQRAGKRSDHDFAGLFAQALEKHFGDLSVLRDRAARCAAVLGERPVAPDLWLIADGRHHFLEVKLPWDSVANRQLAGLALIARHLASELPVSVGIARLVPKNRPSSIDDAAELKKDFKRLCSVVGSR